MNAEDGAITFAVLSDSRVFDEFAAGIRRLTGLAMALNDPEQTRARVPRIEGVANPLCALIQEARGGARRCQMCNRRHFVRAATRQRSVLYTCHAGFLDVAVPIVVAGRHVATISCGQVLAKPPSDAEAERLRKRLHWLPVSAAVFNAAYRKAPYLSRVQLRDVIRLVEIFTVHLCESARRIRELEARQQRREILVAQAFIDKEFRDPDLSLTRVAAAAGLSPAHFCRTFHRAVGVPFARFVQTRRTVEACRLLEQTDRSVTDICFACGFNGLAHFSRVFRRFQHCSPRQYRARQQRRRKTPGGAVIP